MTARILEDPTAVAYGLAVARRRVAENALVLAADLWSRTWSAEDAEAVVRTAGWFRKAEAEMKELERQVDARARGETRPHHCDDPTCCPRGAR